MSLVIALLSLLISQFFLPVLSVVFWLVFIFVTLRLLTFGLLSGIQPVNYEVLFDQIYRTRRFAENQLNSNSQHQELSILRNKRKQIIARITRTQDVLACKEYVEISRTIYSLDNSCNLSLSEVEIRIQTDLLAIRQSTQNYISGDFYDLRTINDTFNEITMTAPPSEISSPSVVRKLVLELLYSDEYPDGISRPVFLSKLSCSASLLDRVLESLQLDDLVIITNDNAGSVVYRPIVG